MLVGATPLYEALPLYRGVTAGSYDAGVISPTSPPHESQLADWTEQASDTIRSARGGLPREGGSSPARVVTVEAGKA